MNSVCQKYRRLAAAFLFALLPVLSACSLVTDPDTGLVVRVITEDGESAGRIVLGMEVVNNYMAAVHISSCLGGEATAWVQVVPEDRWLQMDRCGVELRGSILLRSGERYRVIWGEFPHSPGTRYRARVTYTMGGRFLYEASQLSLE